MWSPVMDTDQQSSEDTADDNERCGICTDVVIDRGVLDCCDHWFCFACIDNWATITNLCPLCKNEFQLITCLPVYDTIGNIKSEDYSLSRDDDWCIQGRNNTLSFPSYYIDEDAVTCLDGDGCKIRSGLSIAEEDLTLDTSIACDSCDVWYHAFCIGFNPECGTSENSWLCPRCMTDEALEKSNAVPSQNIGNCTTLNANTGWTTDSSFSSKVSVSVADDGETAVVVSMVAGQLKPEHARDSISEVELDFNTDKESKAFLLDTRFDNAKPDVQLEDKNCPEVVSNSLNYRTDPSFSSRVSVSAADDGETAVVVSMVEEHQKQEHIGASFSEAKLNYNTDKETEMFCTDTSSGNAKLVVQLENDGHSKLLGNNLNCSDGKGSKASAMEADKNSEILFGADVTEKLLASPSLEDTTSELSVIQADKDLLQASLTVSVAKRVSFPSYYPVTGNASKVDNPAGMISKPSSSGQFEVPFALSCASETKSQNSGSKSVISFHPGQSICSSSADNTIVNIGEDMIDSLPKHTESSDLMSRPCGEIQQYMIDDGHLKNHTMKGELDAERPSKKAKSDGKSQLSLSMCQDNSSALDNSKSVPRKTAHINDMLPKKTKPLDIMSIVKEADRQRSEGPAGAVDKSTTRRENASGLRVKKIMRRMGEKEESSILVQKLREEIREAVRDKTFSNNDTDNDFDVKLLTAFREAIVKPKDELLNKNATTCRSLKKSLLQKGKSRENLTKKIYGTSNGRRKRAWDRDWEIEFWKHRCTRTKPEKVETLHSVLELLKKATNSCSNDSTTDEGPEGETNSILSRVYLADTSLFPRKDDIKPLSALAESSQTLSECDTVKNPTGISSCLPQVKSISSNNKQSSITRMVESTSLSDSIRSKVRELGSSKEVTSLSDSSKVDKRKWAMEVLARKNALISSSGSKEKEEDKSALKGFPLLDQLPMDMRPVPELSRQNKVPISVRQAQLYRITEHFLRRTNLAVMHRTAATELAVADAVNIEKGIFERSNSKLVYVNLCSQALSQHISKPPSAETVASYSSTPAAEVTNQMAEETPSNPSVRGWRKVEEALKLAGLSSDSPPASPSRSTIKDFDVEINPNGDSRKRRPDNVLHIDSHPELDKYGEFEYDRKDDSCELLKLQQEQNRDSKLEPILSTLRCDEPQDSKPQHSDTKEVPSDQNNCNVKKEDGVENGTKKVEIGETLLPKTYEGEMNEEPSFAGYKELYGPDDKPFANKVPDGFMGEPSKYMEIVAVGESVIPCESIKNQSKDGATACEFDNECCADNSFAAGRENSPAHSMASEIGPKVKTEKFTSNKVPDCSNSIFKKVEAYIKEHIRPLCKSGVITVDQYRWAVGKTTDKVMKYHHKAKNASFLIKEGEKVKKLALQYVEASQKNDS